MAFSLNLSKMPQFCNSKVAFGGTWIPAPTGESARARSRMVTRWPSLARAMPEQSPAIPAPQMRIWSFSDIIVSVQGGLGELKMGCFDVTGLMCCWSVCKGMFAIYIGGSPCLRPRFWIFTDDIVALAFRAVWSFAQTFRCSASRKRIAREEPRVILSSFSEGLRFGVSGAAKPLWFGGKILFGPPMKAAKSGFGTNLGGLPKQALDASAGLFKSSIPYQTYFRGRRTNVRRRITECEKCNCTSDMNPEPRKAMSSAVHRQLQHHQHSQLHHNGQNIFFRYGAYQQQWLFASQYLDTF